MNESLFSEKDSRVAKHCTTVFPDKLFDIERSSGAPVIKEAVPRRRRRKFKLYHNQ